MTNVEHHSYNSTACGVTLRALEREKISPKFLRPQGVSLMVVETSCLPVSVPHLKNRDSVTWYTCFLIWWLLLSVLLCVFVHHLLFWRWQRWGGSVCRIVDVVYLISFLAENSRWIYWLYFQRDYPTLYRHTHIYIILMVVSTPFPFLYLQGGALEAHCWWEEP